MSPWTFTSDDNRFDMDFKPVLDRAANMDVKLLKSDQHQVFGLFTGVAVLDNGKRIRIRDFPGFAERRGQPLVSAARPRAHENAFAW